MTITVRKLKLWSEMDIADDMERTQFGNEADYQHRWGAFDGDTMVGTLSASACQNDNSDLGLYVCRCVVLPDYRGRGLHRRLRGHAERWAKARGATWSAALVLWDNLASQHNLYKCGLVPTDTRKLGKDKYLLFYKDM